MRHAADEIEQVRDAATAEEAGTEHFAIARSARRPKHDVAEADELHREAEIVFQTIHGPRSLAPDRASRLRDDVAKILLELSINRDCPRQPIQMLIFCLPGSARQGPPRPQIPRLR